jgi:hypothetical protein
LFAGKYAEVTSEGLAVALGQLVEDRERLKRMGEAAYALMHQGCSPGDGHVSERMMEMMT